MIFSMTGYGKAEHNSQGKKLHIEIKSLNSKSLDLNFRVPSKYRGLELSARKALSKALHRGKLEVNVFEEWVDAQEAAQLNATVVHNYLEHCLSCFDEFQTSACGYIVWSAGRSKHITLIAIGVMCCS